VPPTSIPAVSLVSTLNHYAARLRILSVRSTTEAGSGHPTSCCSAADIVATLFFVPVVFSVLHRVVAPVAEKREPDRSTPSQGILADPTKA